MTLAPIILFVYNRPEHTKQTLAALSENRLADQSSLYVFSDGPKKEASADQLEKIEQTRQLIRSKSWCKEVFMVESAENKGLASAIISGVKEILNTYGKAIVLEDDLLTSPYFLEYMNEGLEIYQDQREVKTISAYIEPIKAKQKEAVLLPVGTSWGWATWKRVFDEIEWDSQALLDQISALSPHDIAQFNYAGEDYLGMLRKQNEGKINSWAIRFYASCFLKKGIHLKPTQSLTKNMGFDSDGTHCKTPHPIHSRTELAGQKIIVKKGLSAIDRNINKKIINIYRRQRCKDQWVYRKNQVIRLLNRLKP